MLIPGGNILNAAMRVIQPQFPRLVRWVSRTKNAAGQWVPSYAAPQVVTGSFQPVSRTLYQQLGLDMDKSYATFYTPVAVRTLERDASGDRLVYAGDLWEAQAQIDWQAQDGWGAYTFVKIGPAA